RPRGEVHAPVLNEDADGRADATAVPTVGREQRDAGAGKRVQAAHRSSPPGPAGTLGTALRRVFWKAANRQRPSSRTATNMSVDCRSGSDVSPPSREEPPPVTTIATSGRTKRMRWPSGRSR